MYLFDFVSTHSHLTLMMLSSAYWLRSFPCLAASCSLKMNQVHGTQYVLNSFAGTDSNSFFSLAVMNPGHKERLKYAAVNYNI